MQEIKVSTRECADQQGRLRRFEYFLLVEEVCVGGFTMENYGVKIKEAGGGSAEIRALTPSQSRIEVFLKLLSDNLVTPVSLGEVTEDWL